VVGKWDRSPQPLFLLPFPTTISGKNIAVNEGEFPQDALRPIAEVIDINPKTEEKFCIIVKHDNQKECFAFGPEIYLYWNPILKQINFDSPSLKLDSGLWSLQVEINYSEG